jgi:hypothetical protein
MIERMECIKAMLAVSAFCLSLGFWAGRSLFGGKQ